jgi:dUTP pyrophosphatase
MKVKIKLQKGATLPKYGRVGDAGLDLTATSKSVDDLGNIVFGTGVHVKIPKGYVGLLFPRSSIANTHMQLSNSVGVIDSNYVGEIMFKFRVLADDCNFVEYNVGDRIGQLIIMPYPTIEFEQVEELSKTNRGSEGFGSSGK